ncbi:hypothetical protein [Xanthomonas phage RTH11]|nr:hypothetical protein [Xanthomonas phage RTH11]
MTWRMRLRLGLYAFGPTFLTYGPEEVKLENTLELILRYIRGEHQTNKGRIALSFTRDGEECYTLSTDWTQSEDAFIEKCRERITWFCDHHRIPLQNGV